MHLRVNLCLARSARYRGQENPYTHVTPLHGLHSISTLFRLRTLLSGEIDEVLRVFLAPPSVPLSLAARRGLRFGAIDWGIEAGAETYGTCAGGHGGSVDDNIPAFQSLKERVEGETSVRGAPREKASLVGDGKNEDR